MFNRQLQPNHRPGRPGGAHALLGRLFTSQGLGSFGGLTQNLKAAGAAAPSPAGLGQPQSLIQFRGKDDDPMMLTASVFAVSPNACGPLTGIIFWGSGNGQNQRAEFDIGAAGNADFNSAIGGSSGGVLISVPATHLELQVRNDGNLLTPFGGVVPIGYATGSGPPEVMGPTVMASLGVGTKISNTRCVRTIRLINAVGGGAGSLPPGGIVSCTIAPFATSFIILRDSSTNSLTVEMSGTGNFMDGPYTITAGTRSPEFPITGWIDNLNITNTGATNINNLSVMFQLSI